MALVTGAVATALPTGAVAMVLTGVAVATIVAVASIATARATWAVATALVTGAAASIIPSLVTPHPVMDLHAAMPARRRKAAIVAGTQGANRRATAGLGHLHATPHLRTTPRRVPHMEASHGLISPLRNHRDISAGADTLAVGDTRRVVATLAAVGTHTAVPISGDNPSLRRLDCLLLMCVAAPPRAVAAVRRNVNFHCGLGEIPAHILLLARTRRTDMPSSGVHFGIPDIPLR